MLVVAVSASYGPVQALVDFSLSVVEGRVTTILGRNGVGKSTLCRCVFQHMRYSGQIIWRGEDLGQIRPWEVVTRGLAYCPERSKVLPSLTVDENLQLGWYSQRKSKKPPRDMLDRVFALFPVLEQRRRQLAGTLSGGEAQMVAIGRALMSRPRMLILDEPSFGLAPNAISRLFEQLRRLSADGVSVMMTEQNPGAALAVADVVHVMEAGRVVFSGSAAEARNSARVVEALLV